MSFAAIEASGNVGVFSGYGKRKSMKTPIAADAPPIPPMNWSILGDAVLETQIAADPSQIPQYFN